MKKVHELNGGVEVLLHEAQRHAHTMISQRCEVIFVLCGKVHDHLNQGVRGGVHRWWVHQGRPSVDIALGGLQELSPQLDAGCLQPLVQFREPRTRWVVLLVWVQCPLRVRCSQRSCRQDFLLPFRGCLEEVIVFEVVQMTVLEEQNRCAERKDDGANDLRK